MKLLLKPHFTVHKIALKPLDFFSGNKTIRSCIHLVQGLQRRQECQTHCEEVFSVTHMPPPSPLNGIPFAVLHCRKVLLSVLFLAGKLHLERPRQLRASSHKKGTDRRKVQKQFSYTRGDVVLNIIVQRAPVNVHA